VAHRDAAFRRLVDEALALLPEGFRPWLDNVVIQIEDWPSQDLMEEEGLEPGEEPYGLYLGTPLLEHHPDDLALPERILIFRGPLEADFPDPEELRDEVAVTVLHEIAHHFGLDEDRLRELGWD